MKKFWNILKKVLLISVGAALAVGFIYLLISAVNHQRNLVCSNIQVKIDYESGNSFLNEEEIIARLIYLSKDSIVGKRLSALDYGGLEKELLKNPYVQSDQIYSDISQHLIVKIKQKQSILRIINRDAVSYYLSNNEEKMPLSDKFTPRVPIALGAVETHEDAYGDSLVLHQLFEMATYIRRDTFLNSLIDQLYVEESGELELFTKFGYHTIYFGRADDGSMPEKFDKLKVFYKKGLMKMGWEKYKTINLKYKDQVVCEKRDSVQIQ